MLVYRTEDLDVIKKSIAEIFTADLKPNMGYSASRVNIVKERANFDQCLYLGKNVL